MIRTTPDKSSVKRASRFAYAAGAIGILANLFLIAFYALQASHPEDGPPSARPTTWWGRSGPHS
jgi:hypothetical protein